MVSGALRIQRKKSNTREYRNLNNFIVAEAKAGHLTGREVWICTDNEVTERIYPKGYSTDKELFEMNLDLTEVAPKNFLSQDSLCCWNVNDFFRRGWIIPR